MSTAALKYPIDSKEPRRPYKEGQSQILRCAQDDKFYNDFWMN